MGIDLTISRKRGACYELKGNVSLYYVFVNDPKEVWKSGDIDALRRIRSRVVNYLVSEANRDGVQLSFRSFEETLNYPGVISHNDHANVAVQLAKKHGFNTLTEYNRHFCAQRGLKQNAFVFLLAGTGRSFAAPSHGDSGFVRSAEYSFVYGADEFTVLHEFLHLFGAADLYYPDSLRKASHALFPNSVMLAKGKAEIDDLTRYLVGWQSKPSPAAQRLINIASAISQEEIKNAEQWNSSYIEQKTETGTYYGPILDGLYSGKGRFVWNDGGEFIGEFIKGKPAGVGVLRYSNNAVYSGQFDGWTPSGRGRLIYHDGSVYEGEFKGGTPSGTGRLTYASGSVYEGEFAAGRPDGKGIFQFPGKRAKRVTVKNGKYIGL